MAQFNGFSKPIVVLRRLQQLQQKKDQAGLFAFCCCQPVAFGNSLMFASDFIGNSAKDATVFSTSSL